MVTLFMQLHRFADRVKLTHVLSGVFEVANYEHDLPYSAGLIRAASTSVKRVSICIIYESSRSNAWVT
jgi:hypothetical protein